MDISSGNILALVFKRVVRKDIGEFSLDSDMLRVLMELDGRQNLGEVAKKTNVNMGVIRKVMPKLLQLKLVQLVESAVSMLDEDFFDYLQAELSLAIGPIAEVLVEDALNDLGHQRTQFPSHRAAELVDLLAREIQREEKMVQFKQNMVNKIREKKY
ncbi:MAG: hypothetical protein JSV50_11100 [Desulfobacteraceae bacterium]|jgi:hypothetical protein|nr:MAG: hypothetical protein JSV50_11100 [Desulfobacteraceae bacterium]